MPNIRIFTIKDMMNIGLFVSKGSQDALIKAFIKGMKRFGYVNVELVKNSYKYWEVEYDLDKYDLVIAYGSYAKLMRECKKLNKCLIIIDFGFLKRENGYFKISVGHWFPSAYFQNIKHNSKRFNILNLDVKPMRSAGNCILVAGIGQRSSTIYNIEHQLWDKNAIKKIKKVTNKKIIYRPRDNTDLNIGNISYLRSPKVSNKIFDQASALVTYASNIAIDGLLRGVPCFSEEGVCLKLGLQDLSLINKPQIVSYDEQLQFFYDLAYTQWNINEIASGQCFKHLLNENLI